MTLKSFDNVTMKWWEIRVRLPLMQMVFLSRALERSPSQLKSGPHASREWRIEADQKMRWE